MKKILAIAVALVLIVAAGVFFWYWMGKPLYEPGMVRAGQNLRAPLTPPAQPADENFWIVESDIKLYHFSEGTGQNVLVIHGGPGYPLSEPISALKPLTKGFKFIYYDQRGCGKSSRPIDRFASSNYYENLMTLDKTLGLGAQIADIERIRRIIKEEKIILIGHSFGAFLASMYAAEFPENVKALVLVAPADLLVMPVENGRLFEEVGKRLPDSLKNEYAAFLKNYLDYGSIFSKSEVDLVSLNGEFGKYYASAASSKFSVPAVNEMGENGGWMVHAMYFSMGRQHDYRAALGKVRAPVLIIHGENDLQPEKASRVYADAFANSAFQTIKNAGHFPFNDQPEEFSRVVGEFLQGVK